MTRMMYYTRRDGTTGLMPEELVTEPKPMWRVSVLEADGCTAVECSDVNHIEWGSQHRKGADGAIEYRQIDTLGQASEWRRTLKGEMDCLVANRGQLNSILDLLDKFPTPPPSPIVISECRAIRRATGKLSPESARRLGMAPVDPADDEC